MKTVNKRQQLNKVEYSVRTSQAVLQYGVGAMVDFPDQTLMTAAPETWGNSIIKIHDERLEKALDVDYFGMPYNSRIGKDNWGISYVRFPEWYFCPKCRSFKPLREWISQYKSIGPKKWVENDPDMVKHMICPICKQALVVSRLVTVCEKGHISDFPWVKWVHVRNFSGSKPVCSHPSLLFKTGNSSNEGLETLRIECKTCGASATLKDAFNPDIFEILSKSNDNNENFICEGKHPWKNVIDQSCNMYPQTKQRGSSSVYFPFSVSSIVIPPYSSILNKKIEQSTHYEAGMNTISQLKALDFPKAVIDKAINSTIKSSAEMIAMDIDESAEQVEKTLKRRWLCSHKEELSILKYKFDEYDALSEELGLPKKDYGDFVRESTNIEDYYQSGAFGIKYIKSISLIKKVREVQALVGFSRLKPLEQNVFSKQIDNIVCVKESNTKWYPAYEVWGEGIFIEIDDCKIKKWLSLSEEPNMRAKLLERRFNESYFGKQNPRKISPKFVLLHTLAHLLIKELSFNCGYSIASLKERIYCSDQEDGKIMSGIFIYTASGDSEGTLGGLVRQGYPDLFPKIFEKAIETAKVCSNDPVCSLSNGQGRDFLNLAACYSCTLIPETSCEEFNIFLDRGLLIGTYENSKLGFFQNQYDNDVENEKNEKSTKAQNTSKVLMLNDDYSSWQDETYDSIWNSLPCNEEAEKDLINKLLKMPFDLKEKPVGCGSFSILGESAKMQYDFAWLKSKVLLFSSENKDDYENSINSDWKCFCLSDKKVNAKLIYDAIEGK